MIQHHSTSKELGNMWTIASKALKERQLHKHIKYGYRIQVLLDLEIVTFR
jgi:hypothetical protein